MPAACRRFVSDIIMSCRGIFFPYTFVQKDDTEETLRNKLKSLERTRNIKVWHDHSDVLNHTYVSFMVSYIYDKANFLTDASTSCYVLKMYKYSKVR
jgi:hypothetical protein